MTIQFQTLSDGSKLIKSAHQIKAQINPNASVQKFQEIQKKGALQSFFLFFPPVATHWIPANQILIVGHCRKPDDGDNGVENEGDEEVLVQRDPLATQAPTSKFQNNK